jgi:microsomal epoxide hydrolase/non-specific protein-tyrosine kinase
MNFPIRQYIPLKDTNIATYQAGPEEGVPIILVHGWPEIAYSWKNQIGPLAAAGYRVIAYDVRGFGYSDAPLEKEHYGIEKLVGDMEGILDALNIEQAVICGHDWGGIIVWHAARMIRARVKGVIGVCTPHVKRPPIDPMRIFENRYGKDHYFVEYKNSTRADALFAKDPDAFFRLMFRTTPKNAKITSEMYHIVKRFEAYLVAGTPELKGSIMSAEDLQVYVDAYTHSGFHGGHNLYRNTTANWEFDETIGDQIEQPSLMISARQDLFLPPEFSDQMVDLVSDLERHVVENCGHWAMWEQPEAINELLLEWLARRMV